VTIPLGSIEDEIASFATRPVLNPGISDHWEMFDPILNNLVGWGKLREEIKQLIHRGPLGMEGFCSWVETLLVEGGIAEALLMGKLLWLIQAMNELSNSQIIFW
jgi:hypothetical protein